MARFEEVGAVCLGGDNLEPHGGWQLYSLSQIFARPIQKELILDYIILSMIVVPSTLTHLICFEVPGRALSTLYQT